MALFSLHYCFRFHKSIGREYWLSLLFRCFRVLKLRRVILEFTSFPCNLNTHLFKYSFRIRVMSDHKELFLFGRAVPSKADENEFIER